MWGLFSSQKPSVSPPATDYPTKINAICDELDALFGKGADIASAATTNLAGLTGSYAHVTGTTTITAFGTVAAGRSVVLVFDGALTLTHNGTSLILPGAGNIITEAGAVARFVSEGGGNWRCAGYFPPRLTSSMSHVCQGRLTLTSGTPVTTSDVTAAETIYFTPFRGNSVALYNGANWVVRPFTELSADIPDATQMNDVFVYDNAGTLTLDVVAWTNDTTRATALTTQDGVYVKTGATGRRYLGSFYSTTAGNGQVQDAIAARYLWNYYHRVRRNMRAVDATASWTYNSAVVRQANANTANQLNFVIGVAEDSISAEARAQVSDNSGNSGEDNIGIGVNSTTVNSAQIVSGGDFPNNTTAAGMHSYSVAKYSGTPAVGKNFLAWLESSGTSGSTGWIAGINSGIVGEISC